MKILQQNSKMKNSSVLTYNFSLPAISTCPGAGACKSFCFAALEQARYPSAMAYRERMLELSQTDSFIGVLVQEIEALLVSRKAKGKQVAVRIHASGDFYSPAYALRWFAIAQALPTVQFYAYTKSIAMFKRLGIRPANLVLIYSLGSNQDALIDTAIDRHSRIFASEADALEAGYVIAAEDDAVAWSSTSTKIGLVMFGARAKKGNAILGNNSMEIAA